MHELTKRIVIYEKIGRNNKNSTYATKRSGPKQMTHVLQLKYKL